MRGDSRHSLKTENSPQRELSVFILLRTNEPVYHVIGAGDGQCLTDRLFLLHSYERDIPGGDVSGSEVYIVNTGQFIEKLTGANNRSGCSG